MRILADFHHADLYYSLHLLFEKRLGWELYRPIGEDWFHEGFWKIAEPYGNDAGTIRQYLSTEVLPWDAFESLNGNYQLSNDVYKIYDPVRRFHQKAITLQTFKEMDFDIVLSSYQPHDASFAELIRKYKPKAKHIAHMGNIWQTTDVQNVMCSTLPYEVPQGKNVVFYHQEFPLDIFSYEENPIKPLVTSFVNLLPMPELYNYFKDAAKGIEFKAYGMGCPDGTITGLEEIAKKMKESSFGYHVKPYGDGFGHIIHNWFAVGRPVFTFFDDYKDKLAGGLLEDGVTAFDLGRRSHEETIRIIRNYLENPEGLEYLSQNAYNRFRRLVDYEAEFVQIKKFLENIQ